jgi:sortase A
METQRRAKDPKRSNYAVFRRRRRIGLPIFLLLVALVLVGLGANLFSNTSGETNETPAEQADTPAVEEPPEDQADTPIAEEETPEEEPAEEEATEETSAKETEEDRIAAMTPADPTLYLSVPRLGLYGHTVRNDISERALDLGAIKLPRTGFPWEKGDTNTYIACHRVGWPGNQSYHQCLNLPAMQRGDEVYLTDANGTVYGYRVSDVFAVSPNDSWVTMPLAGKDVVSLQTCTENPNDWWTLGPGLFGGGPESGRLIVQAERVGVSFR